MKLTWICLLQTVLALPLLFGVRAETRSFAPHPGLLYPSFSPNGEVIAAVQVDPALEVVRLVLLRESSRDRLEVLADDLTPASRPAWSPVGTAVTYVTEVAEEPRLVIRTLKTGVRKEIVLPDREYTGGIVWNAQGNRVLLGVDELLCEVDLDTGGFSEKCVDPQVYSISSVLTSFSASRGRLAIAGREVGKRGEASDHSIWVLPIDGKSQALKVTSGAHDSDPAWSADGSKIAFSRVGDGEEGKASFLTSHLWLVNLETGTTQQLTFGFVKDRFPTLSPRTDSAVFSRIDLKTASQDCRDRVGVPVTGLSVKVLLDEIGKSLICLSDARLANVVW